MNGVGEDMWEGCLWLDFTEINNQNGLELWRHLKEWAYHTKEMIFVYKYKVIMICIHSWVNMYRTLKTVNNWGITSNHSESFHMHVGLSPTHPTGRKTHYDVIVVSR